MTRRERYDAMEMILRQVEVARGLKKLRERCFDESQWAEIIDEALPRSEGGEMTKTEAIIIGSIWRRDSDGEMFTINVITGHWPASIRLAFLDIDSVFWVNEDTLRAQYSPIEAKKEGKR